MSLNRSIPSRVQGKYRRSDQQGRFPAIPTGALGPRVGDHLIVGVGVALHCLDHATASSPQQCTGGRA